MAESDEYLLGRSQVEEERLRRQVQELAGEARWLLDQLPFRRVPGRSTLAAVRRASSTCSPSAWGRKGP